MAYTEDKHAEFVMAMADGKSRRQIAEQLNVSLPTVQKWAKEFNAEIEDARNERRKTVIEQYTAIKQAHMQTLANELTTINTELSTRDYSDVPTDKLLDFKLKYQKELIAMCEKEQSIFNIDNLTDLEDYNAEFEKIYNAVAMGTLTPNQAKALTELLKTKRELQRRQVEIENPQTWETLYNGQPNPF